MVTRSVALPNGNSCKVPTIEFGELAPCRTEMLPMGFCGYPCASDLGEAQPLWWRAEIVSVSSYSFPSPGILPFSPSIHAAQLSSEPWLTASSSIKPSLTCLQAISPCGCAAAPLFTSWHCCYGCCVRTSLPLPYVPLGRADNAHMKYKNPRVLS